jgi:hypothetical protein
MPRILRWRGTDRIPARRSYISGGEKIYFVTVSCISAGSVGSSSCVQYVPKRFLSLPELEIRRVGLLLSPGCRFVLFPGSSNDSVAVPRISVST